LPTPDNVIDMVNNMSAKQKPTNDDIGAIVTLDTARQPPPQPDDGPTTEVPEIIEPDEPTPTDDVITPSDAEIKNQLGSTVIEGLRKSNRINGKHVEVFRLSVHKALSTHGDVAKQACAVELQQMLDRDVFEFINPDTKVNSKIIRSSMFLKEKFDAAGTFIKKKRRVVVVGENFFIILENKIEFYKNLLEFLNDKSWEGFS
jgi:hypothetical protein